MKPSQNLLDSLQHMDSVKTAGDLSQIISNACLALVRKEISATDLLALAGAGDTIVNIANMQCKVAITAQQLREKGAEFGTIKRMGALLIGGAEDEKT